MNKQPHNAPVQTPPQPTKNDQKRATPFAQVRAPLQHLSQEHFKPCARQTPRIEIAAEFLFE
jgi:hypothetical protein